MLSWFEKNNKISWIITIIIAVIIFYMSSLTFESAGGSKGFGYKADIYHISIFFLFAFFLSISLIKGKNKKFILLVIIISVLYGFSDEFHQIFVPGRVSSLSDVFLDCFGILIASTLYIGSLEYRIKKHFHPFL